MINDEVQQVLLYQFFALLEQQALEDARAFVGMLAQRCSIEPTLQPLHDYCAALLLQAGSQAFAAAQQRYQRLLAAEIDPFLAGMILISLATAQMQLADFDSAQRSAQQAIAIFQSLKLPLEIARALAQQGLAYYRADQAEKGNEQSLRDGVACCQAALAHLQRLPINHQTGYVWLQVWHTLGQLYTALGHWNEALNAYLASLPIADQIQRYEMLALAQCNSAKIRRQFGEGALLLAAEEIETALVIFRELERDADLLRALVDAALIQMARNEHQAALAYIDEALGLVEKVQSNLAGHQAQAAFQATIADLYANAVACAVESNQPARAFTYMEEARRQSLMVQRSQVEATTTDAFYPTIPTLAQVQAALPTKALLLAYFTTEGVEGGIRDQSATATAKHTAFLPATILLLAITAKTVAGYRLALSPHEIKLPTAAAVGEGIGEAPFLSDAIYTHLYDQLIRPIVPYLTGKQTLLIIPHGPLHAVSFPALRGEAGRRLLSIGGPRMIFASSVAMLLRNQPLTLQWSYRQGDSQPAVVVGCNHTPQRVYAEAEAVMIGALTQGQLLIGPHPKMAELSQLTAAAQLIHFAGHGRLDTTVPFPAALQLSADELLTTQQVVAEVKLPAAPLVILSISANGVNPAQVGDECLDFMRAFFAAGAAVLVAPQWRVDEQATYLLMSKFYERLLHGEDLATALHLAQFYLQGLTVADLLRIVAQIRQSHPRLDATLIHALDEMTAELLCLSPASTPFAAPYYWAPFLLFYG